MRKGFICGVFDLFHAGHVIAFQECKEHCEYLVLGLNRAENIDPEINPGKNQPVYSFEDRKLILEQCRLVDEVIPYSIEKELEEIMSGGDFSVRFLGEDYRNKPITGAHLIPEVVYLGRSHGKSSSDFRKEIWKAEEQKRFL